MLMKSMSILGVSSLFFVCSKNSILSALISLEAMAMTSTMVISVTMKGSESAMILALIISVSESVLGMLILAGISRNGSMDSIKIINMQW